MKCNKTQQNTPNLEELENSLGNVKDELWNPILVLEKINELSPPTKRIQRLLKESWMIERQISVLKMDEIVF